MSKTPLEELKEWEIVETQDSLLNNVYHPFKDGNKLIGNTFYFLKTEASSCHPPSS